MDWNGQSYPGVYANVVSRGKWEYTIPHVTLSTWIEVAYSFWVKKKKRILNFQFKLARSVNKLEKKVAELSGITAEKWDCRTHKTR